MLRQSEKQGNQPGANPSRIRAEFKDVLGSGEDLEPSGIFDSFVSMLREKEGKPVPEAMPEPVAPQVAQPPQPSSSQPRAPEQAAPQVAEPIPVPIPGGSGDTDGEKKTRSRNKRASKSSTLKSLFSRRKQSPENLVLEKKAPESYGRRATDSRQHPDERVDLNEALRASRGAFAATGVFSFFINILMLAGPLYMLQVYDRVLTSKSVPTLVALSILVTGLFVVMGILELIRSRVLVRVGTRLDNRLSSRVFDIAMRWALFPKPGNAGTRALNELTILRQFLTGPGPFALFDAPWVPFYIAVIFLLDWRLGVLAIIAAIVLFTIAYTNDKTSREPLDEANKAYAKAGLMADAGQRNAEVLAALGMTQNVRALWQRDHQHALIHQAQASDRSGALTSLSKAMRLFFQSAMLGAGAWLAIEQIITPGAMIAASIILGRALQPVEQAISQWRGFTRAREAHGVLSELFEKSPETRHKLELPEPKGLVSVRKLVATVPETGRVIFRDVNFELQPGQVLGVIGPSASGKSTLARCMVGVWPIASGEIRLDDAKLDQWNEAQLGNYVGYLPQDVELLDGTISQNISRFRSDVDDAMIIDAARKAGVHEMILSLPNGYDTVLGIQGSNISAGQRQRIALARALYGDPVMIVLDEPNSNLDGNGDLALQKAIVGMKKRGQTVVVIAHRKEVLGAVDMILHLEAGRPQACGPRDQVLAKLAGNQPKDTPAGEARRTS